MMRTAIMALGLVGLCSALHAAEEKTVYLVDNDGQRTEVATLNVAADDSYTMSLSEDAFSDHFLSMRPFKCLEGPEKHWCHVPYPYPIARNTSEDLIDLEYDFLFLWKGATDYGIDTWNGIYYVMTAEAERIVGQAHEIDLGGLAVPPAEGEMRPVRAGDLHETDADSHWLPVLVIE